MRPARPLTRDDDADADSSRCCVVPLGSCTVLRHLDALVRRRRCSDWRRCIIEIALVVDLSRRLKAGEIFVDLAAEPIALDNSQNAYAARAIDSLAAIIVVVVVLHSAASQRRRWCANGRISAPAVARVFGADGRLVFVRERHGERRVVEVVVAE
jgi:hypothetical protein